MLFGLFALREICLFCEKICQRETIFSANDLFDPQKFSQVPPNFKYAVNQLWRPTVFMSGEKIYCSLTDILQLVMIEI